MVQQINYIGLRPTHILKSNYNSVRTVVLHNMQWCGWIKLATEIVLIKMHRRANEMAIGFICVHTLNISLLTTN